MVAPRTQLPVSAFLGQRLLATARLTQWIRSNNLEPDHASLDDRTPDDIYCCRHLRVLGLLDAFHEKPIQNLSRLSGAPNIGVHRGVLEEVVPHALAATLEVAEKIRIDI